MRRIATSFLIAAAMAALMPAQTEPAPCKSGTLQEYIDLFQDLGCTIGGTVFGGFELVPTVAGAEPTDPLNVRITPVNDSRGQGLEFAVNLSALSGRISELSLGFIVSRAGLTRNTLSTSGATATGDGAVAVVEKKCLGDWQFSGLCFVPTTATSIAAVISDQEVPAEPLTFEPVDMIGVALDIVVDGGLNGQAALVSSRVQFQ